MPAGARVIDPSSWARREHFETFRRFTQPQFSMCAEMDMTAIVLQLREHPVSLNTVIVYVVARAANDVPELRQRIRDDTVVEHDVVHPATTVMAAGDLFAFACFEFELDFDLFAARVAEETARVQANPSLEDPPGRDDLLFMTAIPWVAFTSFEHPITGERNDSVPRFAWGRCHEVGERHVMPLNVQLHHALADGIHAGRFYERVGHYLDDPTAFLG